MQVDDEVYPLSRLQDTSKLIRLQQHDQPTDENFDNNQIYQPNINVFETKLEARNCPNVRSDQPDFFHVPCKPKIRVPNLVPEDGGLHPVSKILSKPVKKTQDLQDMFDHSDIEMDSD